MADGFIAAVKTVSSFRATKDQPAIDVSNVTWTHAWIGVALVVAIQAVLLWIPFAGLPSEALAMLPDLALVAALALAVPFAVMATATALAGKSDRLPAAFLFLAVFLTLMQVVLFALSWFIEPGSGATIGALAVVGSLCARNIVGLGTGASILVAAMIALGTFGVGFVLLALPTGQAMLAAG